MIVMDKLALYTCRPSAGCRTPLSLAICHIISAVSSLRMTCKGECNAITNFWRMCGSIFFNDGAFCAWVS